MSLECTTAGARRIADTRPGSRLRRRVRLGMHVLTTVPSTAVLITWVITPMARWVRVPVWWDCMPSSRGEAPRPTYRFSGCCVRVGGCGIYKYNIFRTPRSAV